MAAEEGEKCEESGELEKSGGGFASSPGAFYRT